MDSECQGVGGYTLFGQLLVCSYYILIVGYKQANV